ncbi:hypothetical protein PMAC_001125 [Pneumocystis sp. 'macacae']|nr:hypothetical protein PMAC_001125 [Pneumocystis sp. 'macacae']
MAVRVRSRCQGRGLGQVKKTGRGCVRRAEGAATSGVGESIGRWDSGDRRCVGRVGRYIRRAFAALTGLSLRPSWRVSSEQPTGRENLGVALAQRQDTDAAALTGADTDDVAVDGAGDTVVELDVELGKGILLVDAGVGDVADGGRLDDVPWGVRSGGRGVETYGR